MILSFENVPGEYINNLNSVYNNNLNFFRLLSGFIYQKYQ